MPSDLKSRIEPPVGHRPMQREPEPPVRPEPPIEPVRFPMPTPPEPPYSPNPIFRSPMPAILTEPDQQRQFYGRGLPTKRFWPTTNGIPTQTPATAVKATVSVASQTGTATSASGTTVTWSYKVGFLSTPSLTIIPLSNCGAWYISTQTASGFTITYATSGAQKFQFAAVS